MPEIEILRVGTFEDNNGIPHTFTQNHLKEIAESYDPANFRAPLIITHNTHGVDDASLSESPLAYGFPQRLRVVGDRLKAVFDKIAPQFRQWVKDGQVLSISSSLYPPNVLANPTPGRWSLRHIAGLGKEPPAIKGLAPLSLSEFLDGAEGAIAFDEFHAPDDSGCVSFSAANFSQSDRMVGELMDQLREYLIEKEGREAADRVIPREMVGYFMAAPEVDMTQELLSEMDMRISKLEYPDKYKDKSSDEYADPCAAKNLDSDLIPDYQETDIVTQQDYEAQIKKLQQEKAEAEQMAIAAQQKLRRTEITSFCESLPEQITPAMMGTHTVNFGEGESTEMTLVDFMSHLDDQHLEFMKGHLKGLPKQIEFNEMAGSKDDPEMPESPDEDVTEMGERMKLHKRIKEYQEQHKLTFQEAFDMVNDEMKKETMGAK